LHTGVDKTKNNSEASPFFSGASIFFSFLQIRAKKILESEFENSGAPVFVYPCSHIYNKNVADKWNRTSRNQQLYTFKHPCPPQIKITNQTLNNKIKITTLHFSDLCMIICKKKNGSGRV
jgi:hypothetical protein